MKEGWISFSVTNLSPITSISLKHEPSIPAAPNWVGGGGCGTLK